MQAFGTSLFAQRQANNAQLGHGHERKRGPVKRLARLFTGWTQRVEGSRVGRFLQEGRLPPMSPYDGKFVELSTICFAFDDTGAFPDRPKQRRGLSMWQGS